MRETRFAYQTPYEEMTEITRRLSHAGQSGYRDAPAAAPLPSYFDWDGAALHLFHLGLSTGLALHRGDRPASPLQVPLDWRRRLVRQLLVAATCGRARAEADWERQQGEWSTPGGVATH